MAKSKDLRDVLANKKKRHKRRRSSSASIPVVASPSAAAFVALDAVRTDGDTQPRVSMDPEVIEEYAERMRVDPRSGQIVDPEGEAFPPVVLYRDAADALWLADGFHRLEAARRKGLDEIQATFRQGELADAVIHSLGANARHGKRRTNADKRRAVTRALEDEELGARSDSQIANICKVSDRFVSKLRQELILEHRIPYHPRLLGKDGQWRDVAPPEGFQPLEEASPEEPPREAPTPATSRARGKNKSEAPTHEPIDALAHATPLPDACLVTHPLTLEDFEIIAEHAPRLLERGRLIIAAPQGNILGLTGPARLARLLLEHDFSGPHHIHLREHGRTYLAFRCGASVDELSGVCALEVVTGDLEVTCYGAPLGAWS